MSLIPYKNTGDSFSANEVNLITATITANTENLIELSAKTITSAFTESRYQKIGNYLTGLTSTSITNALGYTPASGSTDLTNYYNKTQSDGRFLTGYTLTSSAITTALGYVPSSGGTSTGSTGDLSNYYTKTQSDTKFLSAITSSLIVNALGYVPSSGGTSGGTSDLNYVPKSDFFTLSADTGNTVTWDTNFDKFPEGKITATSSFTMNMLNVKSGSQGVLKVIIGTSNAVTIFFDTDFTNKQLNTAIPNYTFSIGSGKEYFLNYICDGTTLEWFISDGATLPYSIIDYVPAVTGFATIVNTYGRYMLQGKICTVLLYIAGVSNATTFTLTLPFLSSSNLPFQGFTGTALDNGTYLSVAVGRIASGTTGISVGKGGFSGAWTASGNKGFIGNFIYEIA